MLIGTLTVRATGMTYPFLGFRLADFGYGPTDSGWVLACFGAGWLVGPPAIGWTTDHYGPRRALVLAMTAGAIGIPASISAHTLPWLMAGAALAGAVYDAPRPVVSAVIAAELPDEADRVRVGGWRHGATNLGAAIVCSILGEIAFFMAAGDLLNRIAPPALRGAYSGLWGTTLALASCAAPLAAAGAFARGGPHLVGAVITAAGLLGTVLCLPLVRSLPHPRLALPPGL